MKCAHNGTAIADIKARDETAQVEAMEADLAADPTAAGNNDRPETGGRRREANLQPPASSLQPHQTGGRRPEPGVTTLPPASSLQPPASGLQFLADLLAETSDRVEGLGVCMTDVGEALSGTGGNSAWVQNQCQAAAANARRAADLFDRIAEHLTDPPTARALIKRLDRTDRKYLSEATDAARWAGTELWAVIGERMEDPQPWKWTLLTIQRKADKAATARKNWNAQPGARATHAVRVV